MASAAEKFQEQEAVEHQLAKEREEAAKKRMAENGEEEIDLTDEMEKEIGDK